MRLKVEIVEDGLHPHQVIVGARSRDGMHYFAIQRAAIDGNETIEIGSPLAYRDEERLIELPTEADDGSWRLWVSKSDVSPHSTLEAAE